MTTNIDVSVFQGKSLSEIQAIAANMAKLAKKEELARLRSLVAVRVDTEFASVELGECIAYSKLYNMCVDDNEGVGFDKSILNNYLRLDEEGSRFESVKGRKGGVRVCDHARTAKIAQLKKNIADMQAKLARLEGGE